MKNTKLTKLALIGIISILAHTTIGANFRSIRLDTPTFSDEDPLGVQAISNATEIAKGAQTTASSAQQAANDASDAASNAATVAENAQTSASQALTQASDIKTSLDVFKNNMTNSIMASEEVVVVGKVKGTSEDVGMISSTTSVVFGVNRDIDEMQAENGQILMVADKMKFDAPLGEIYFGSKSIQTLLSEAGSSMSGGQSNVIEVVKVNGVALEPDEDKAVDITIPAPGDPNVIEVVKTNGVAVAVNNKEVDITIPSIDGKLDALNGIATGSIKVQPDPDDPSFVIGLGKVEVTHDTIKFLTTENVPNAEYKKDEILSGGESYKFDDSTNGVARLKDVHSATNGLYQTMTNEFVKIADLQDGITFDTISVTNLTIDGKKPSLEGHTHTVSEITDLNDYKNPAISAAALAAINGINNAQDISEIQTALTNFLQQAFVNQ